MKIQVFKILDEGFFQKFSEKDEWARLKFSEAFAEHWKAAEGLSGTLEVHKTGQNLHFKGSLNFDYHVPCDRCLNSYLIPVRLKAERWMTPLYESERQRANKEEEEIELNTEDTNFSFYKGDAIDLGEVLAEEVFLDLPMVFLCKPDCKGLCPSCGVNLNEENCKENCDHVEQIKEASPFSVLNQIVVKKK